MRVTVPASGDWLAAGKARPNKSKSSSGASRRASRATRPRCHAGGVAVNFLRQRTSRSGVDADERVAERVDLTGHVRQRAAIALPALDVRAAGTPAPLPHPAIDNDLHVVLARELARQVLEQLRLETRDDEEVRDHRSFV